MNNVVDEARTAIHELVSAVATGHAMKALNEGRLEIDESATRAKKDVATWLRAVADAYDPPKEPKT